MNDAIALAELIAYITDTKASSEHTPVFRLADLNKMYSTRVEQLGTALPSGRVNSTLLKERIFLHNSLTW